MRKCLMIAVTMVASVLGAVTATKEWVQTATNAVLQQAMAYTDAHKPKIEGFLPQYGGVATNLMMRSDSWEFRLLDYDGVPHMKIGFIGAGGDWLLELPTPVENYGRVDKFAMVSDIPDIAPFVSTQSIDHATIQAWQTYWDGDDVRVTVTNYFGQIDNPSLYIEQKMPADDYHADSWFRTVWDERTRWNEFLGTFNTWKSATDSAIDQKADRAWGFYDSHTGGYSPEGYTQVSSSNILIAAGMAYQRHVTSEGSVWLLESNGMVANVGGDAGAGFFRVQDDDGNSLFEIKKGDRREVGATANSLTSASVEGVIHLMVTYNVVSADPPKLYTARALGTTFVAEDSDDSPVTVNWTGSSGAWVCEFYYKSGISDKSKLFAKAGYMVGGETIIKQSVPTQMDSIMLNGVKYYLGTATINGNTVLTLRTTP